MNTLATGWQAVSYGHATFSIYNFVSAGAENREAATSVITGPVSDLEPADKASSATLPTLSEVIPALP